MRNARVTKRVQEDTSRTNAFETVHDEPPILLGNNAGANPGESLLSCEKSHLGLPPLAARPLY